MLSAMILPTRILALLLLLGSPLALRAADAAPASPYAPIAWLAGGTWKAALPPRPDGTTVGIELRVERPANGQGLRFDSSFLFGGKPSPYSSGMYAWDAAKKKFAIFYTDSHGALSAGDVTLEGGVLVHEMTVAEADGTISPVRVRMKQTAPDAYTSEIYVQKDGAWTLFVTVHYERQT